MRLNILTIFLLIISINLSASPIEGLLERIDAGASRKFIIEKVKNPTDFFELDQKGNKVVIRGNNDISIATGINWYLKYHAGIHLTWNNMKASLPDTLPAVKQKERHETNLPYRYDLNYCTFSYSMSFWDWARWEKEIDWMALHGINLSLAVTGTESVWKNMLSKLGYSKTEINEFIAGPGFQAWWLMNNLEGWGGPNPDHWYIQQEQLQKRILKRMREFGIHPVLPGYAGMVPHNAREKLGLNVADPGLWCSYHRPAFLQPEDKRFQEIASLYYKELTRLYGKADFYSIDPFHEGGNTSGVNLDAAGKAIMSAMKKVNANSTWVVQAWQDNPRQQMIENMNAGDLLVLDLNAECRPQWGDTESEWYHKNGFGQHDWIYCMLLNFGGNVGLHGRMDALINGYYKAKNDIHASKTMRGVGMTPEGIENNPVMYELVLELPWRAERFTKEQWINDYVWARYGTSDTKLIEVWQLLGKSIYNSPKDKIQQGAHESIFCARPDLDAYQVSSWSEMKDYYEPTDVIKAAEMMLAVADKYQGNNNFEYDLVDVVRQALAEKGRLTLKIVKAAYQAQDKSLFEAASNKFIKLIDLQDQLLGTRPEFMVGQWIDQARRLGLSKDEKDLYEWNARMQISSWGNRTAANEGGLHDYAHKEWNGILKDLYKVRWTRYFDMLKGCLNGKPSQKIDYYAIEENWANRTNPYPATAQGNSIHTAHEVWNKANE